MRGHLPVLDHGRMDLAPARYIVPTGLLDQSTLHGVLAEIEALGVEISDDLDAEPVLLQRHDSRLQRRLIRQRGKPIRNGSRAHCWSSLRQVAPRNPGSP